MRPLSILAVSCLMAACSGAPVVAQDVPSASAPDIVYVCNQGDATVTLVDATSLNVVGTVDLKALGYAENAKPHHVVVEPDGSHWYLSLIGANRVLRFNRSNRVVGAAEFEVPGMLVLHPDGEHVLVGRSMSAVNPPQSVGMIRTADMSVEEIDVFFPRPHALAVSPDGRTVYSASLVENRMIAIDLETGDGAFTVLDGPVHTLVQFAVSPADGSLLVGGQMTGTLLRLTGARAGAEAILMSSMQGASQPWHPVFDARGRFAYVPNKGNHSVSVFDAVADTVVSQISGYGLAQPHGSALSADGRYLFVSNQNMDGTYRPGHELERGEDQAMEADGHADHRGTLVVIETATREIVRVIEIGRMPSGVGSRGAR